MIGQLLHFLRRVGLVAYKPYKCRLCGHQIPVVGDRRTVQAFRAYEHYVEAHDTDDKPGESK